AGAGAELCCGNHGYAVSLVSKSLVVPAGGHPLTREANR
ncbi:MAG: hypothetical protein QOK26_2562, partial [Pseudonocardiales bacterium]|nr:hypothetical protein [Pseudonocardiales bacterium]